VFGADLSRNIFLLDIIKPTPIKGKTTIGKIGKVLRVARHRDSYCRESASYNNNIIVAQLYILLSMYKYKSNTPPASRVYFSDSIILKNALYLHIIIISLVLQPVIWIKFSTER
jgi:hypothetical protein